MIAVVDYCKGNLKSVERGLRAVGGDAFITDNPEDIARAEAVVLPGVGAFADASQTMIKTGQMRAIRAAIEAGKPFLGICLGEHLLFEKGTEGAQIEGEQNEGTQATSEGLSLLKGTVEKMPEFDEAQRRYKIPHVGWNSIEFDTSLACPLLAGIEPGEHFYFTHSYIAPQTSATIATTTHSTTFPSVVRVNDVVYGVQFHPEKSSDAGAQVLKNFLAIVESQKA
jgi:imidazole glycerol-phosphate synthase subunit HisH